MSNFDCTSDEELISRIRNGEDGAEEALILRYMSYVRSFSRSYFLAGGDFEDIIQEGMIGVVKAISQFDASRHTSFRTFAASCIKNRIYSVIRNSQRAKNLPLNNYISLETLLPSDAQLAAVSPDPVEGVIKREAYDELRARVKELLSKFEKTVFDLYLEGLSYSEISERVSKPEKSVDNAVCRIRRKLSALSQSNQATSGFPV